MIKRWAHFDYSYRSFCLFCSAIPWLKPTKPTCAMANTLWCFVSFARDFCSLVGGIRTSSKKICRNVKMPQKSNDVEELVIKGCNTLDIYTCPRTGRRTHTQSCRALGGVCELVGFNVLWSGRSWHDGECQSQACECLTLISYSLTSSAQQHRTRERWFILHDNYEC